MNWWGKKTESKEEVRLREFAASESDRRRAVLVEKDHYKALLFDAWKSLAQQQKGMRRMARKIKRLHRELQAAKECK